MLPERLSNGVPVGGLDLFGRKRSNLSSELAWLVCDLRSDLSKKKRSGRERLVTQSVDKTWGMCYSQMQQTRQRSQEARNPMRDALSVTLFGLKDLWEDFVILVLMNLLWFITLVLPVLPTVIFGASQPTVALALGIVLLIPLPIVSAGICFVTNQITRGYAASWSMFAQGVHRYWGKSLIVALVNLIVLILLATNIQFYGIVLQGTWTTFAMSIWIVLSGYWLLVQVYWFPMMLELESEKLLLALRNALLMPLVSPGFSLLLSIILVLLIALSAVLTIPLVLLTTVLLMLIANHATRSRLAYAQKKPYNPGPPEE